MALNLFGGRSGNLNELIRLCWGGERESEMTMSILVSWSHNFTIDLMSILGLYNGSICEALFSSPSEGAVRREEN